MSQLMFCAGQTEHSKLPVSDLQLSKSGWGFSPFTLLLSDLVILVMFLLTSFTSGRIIISTLWAILVLCWHFSCIGKTRARSYWEHNKKGKKFEGVTPGYDVWCPPLVLEFAHSVNYASLACLYIIILLLITCSQHRNVENVMSQHCNSPGSKPSC